jgi:hypothetical protein
MSAEQIDAAFRKLQSTLLDLGCSDGGCCIRKPRGMHTNGGCQCGCEREIGPSKAQRALRAYQLFARTVGGEEP